MSPRPPGRVVTIASLVEQAVAPAIELATRESPGASDGGLALGLGCGRRADGEWRSKTLIGCRGLVRPGVIASRPIAAATMIVGRRDANACLPRAASCRSLRHSDDAHVERNRSSKTIGWESRRSATRSARPARTTTSGLPRTNRSTRGRTRTQTVARDSCPQPPNSATRNQKRPNFLAFLQADDGSRTRDLRLGKPTLYQLSYVRDVRRILRIRGTTGTT